MYELRLQYLRRFGGTYLELDRRNVSYLATLSDVAGVEGVQFHKECRELKMRRNCNTTS